MFKDEITIRIPWALPLPLIVTFGLYRFWWWYQVNREMRDLGRQRGTSELGTSPALSLLAFSFGGLLIIPLIWTIATTTIRVRRTAELVGEEPINPWLVTALWIFTLGIGAVIYMQASLNKVWRRVGTFVPSEAATNHGSLAVVQ